MEGFKKYLIILGSVLIVLWFISIMIYWDIIADYLGQSMNALYQSGVTIFTYIIMLVLIVGLLFKTIG